MQNKILDSFRKLAVTVAVSTMTVTAAPNFNTHPYNHINSTSNYTQVIGGGVWHEYARNACLSYREEALSFFGPQEYFSDEELAYYHQVLDLQSEDLGFSIEDLM